MLVDHLQRMASFTERGWAIHIDLGSKLGTTRTRNENLGFALGYPARPGAPVLRRVFALEERRHPSADAGAVVYLQQFRTDVRRVQPPVP